ncbi:unnamed protein product [Prunus armeniaca]
MAQGGIIVPEEIGTIDSIHKTSKEVVVKVVYKGKARCGKCNWFGHTTKDYDSHSHKQVANCAKEEVTT